MSNSEYHMRQLRDFLQKVGQFSTLEKFIAEYGTGFPTLAPDQPKPGRIKHCFKNATELVMSRKGLRYVEGFAHGAVIPVHHAWCVDAAGHVIEATWPVPGAAYVGIPFRPKRLWKLISELGHYGLFADDAFVNIDLMRKLNPKFELPKGLGATCDNPR